MKVIDAAALDYKTLNEVLRQPERLCDRRLLRTALYRRRNV